MNDPPPGATRLGILSDTHNRVDLCREGVKALLDLGAQALAHCGDVGDEAVLDELAGHPAWLVWGNIDLETARLAPYCQSLGLSCLDRFGRFTFAGKQFAITHGDNGRHLEAVRQPALVTRPALGQTALDHYLLSGHTHVPHDRRIGKLRWINPGALYRARPKTVALLDVVDDELTWCEL
jgi:putative phosphoesterase